MSLKKIPREIRRIWQKLRYVPEFFYEPIIHVWYEKYGKGGCEWIAGDGKPTEKVAVFVIFQPHGVRDSIFLTLSHLCAHGYSVFLVSNAELLPDDLIRLRSYSWKILVRPNVGYDFGAYRDAVRYLLGLDLLLSRLVLLNDSVWFPSVQGDRTLSLMEGRAEDFVGVQEFYKKKRSFPLAEKGGKKFFPSYLLMFTGALVRSDAFRKFWSSYRISSNKLKVMARGERQLSFDVIGAGYSSGCILSEASILKSIGDVKDFSAKKILAWCAFIDPVLDAQRAEIALIKNPSISKEKTLQLISAAYRRRNILGEIPVYIGEQMKIGLIKKNAQPLYRLARKQVAAASVAGEISLAEAVCQEVLLRVSVEKDDGAYSHL